MTTRRVELEQRLAQVVKEKWDTNVAEYMVGAVSSLLTEEQLETLIKANEER
jgi:lipoprotein NlpI